MEERKPDIKKGILHRVQVLYVLFFIIGLMIVGKILYLQYGPKSGRLKMPENFLEKNLVL